MDQKPSTYQSEYKTPYRYAGVNSMSTTTKDRICLKCDKPFLSFSPANRICNKCNTSNNALVSREDDKTIKFIPAPISYKE